MKQLFPLLLLLLTAGALSAQTEATIEQLQAEKAAAQAKLDAASAEAAAAQGTVDDLQKQINALSGWMTGFTGLVGFNLAGSNQWIANPNPTSRSSALTIGLTAFANREAPKYFWNNKLIVNRAWQRVDINGTNESSLFDNGTVDILNLSSLGGYKLNDKLALTGLGEINTSMSNFFQPGTLDIGVGATWKPITNLVVVVHPLNYRITWSAFDNVDSEGALGAKIRADYQDELLVASRKIAWSSTLTSFLPYSSNEITLDAVDEFGVPNGMTRQAGLFEWTWLNTFSFQIWEGIGVGATLGLRNAEFEFEDLQTFYTLGLTYTL